MPDTQAAGIKAQLLALSEGDVKIRAFLLKYFLNYRKKNDT